MATEGRALTDRYRLLRLLGSGGSSSVHEAEDLALDRRVAVKLLADGPEPAGVVAAERFRREAATLARISSPYVVAVLDAGTDATGTPFVVMELLDGVGLDALVDTHGALPPDVAEAVAASVCAGLAVVHEAGVVHRDVKPSNVMITRVGRVVLQDFGLARTVDNSPVTELGEVVGTPRYLPPETLRGASPRPAADLYGLGTCLYTMLSGRHPFAGEEEIAPIILQVVDTGLPRLAGTPGIPARLAELTDALTERDADLRPVSAADVLGRLETTVSAELVRQLRDLVADCIRDQALATVHRPAADVPAASEGVPLTAPRPAPGDGRERPEEISGLHTTAVPTPVSWPTTSAADGVPGGHPVGLSSTTQQMVMSGMTEAKATSRLREAVTLVHRGDLQEAVRILGTLARVCPISLGAGHPTTLAAQFWQAMCLSREGAGGEAVVLFSAVSERCEAERNSGRG
ncbi:serine/threonine protein kinase [Streptomyces cocklensis]|uniref:non-specific serine/threonine protein kinase n=1 Tax=Actinacidiphila cocklensis TaxID=887465 RepID=A0A9W4DLZ4_9ACTN|nr:serine/threonine-protein kinase [Actinacidiphila cocklensis]MDD1062686.1 serine/threonine protein kinase [Actinacidiphila cocklensis]CAG6392088.1 Non-specific serine/threonine protein kinase [Actinacidiphila cocklensis]